MAPFITGVLPINSVFLIVACMFLGEKTTRLQNSSIAVAVGGLAVMATADTSSEGVKGILYGLVVAALFAAGNFGIKYATLRGVDHLTSASLLWLGMGVVGLLFSVVECASNGMCFKGLERLKPAWGDSSSPRLYLFSAMSGVLHALAIGCMKLTVSAGPAAPGMAIANANAIAILALNQIFFQPPTKTQQIVGLFISMVGVAALSVAPKSKVDVARTDGLPLTQQSNERI